MRGKPDGVTPVVAPGEAPLPVTTCRIAGEVLLPLPPVPTNLPVMAWFPAASFEVANVARPPINGAVPRFVEPSKKVTVPLAAGPGPVTVATNSTTWPTGEGFADETTVVPVPLPLPGAVVDEVDPPVPGAVVLVDPPVPAEVVLVDDSVVLVGAKQAPLASVVVVPAHTNVLVTVVVQVTVLAPVVPDALHWSTVTMGAASVAAPAVAVQVNVPVAPELLH